MNKKNNNGFGENVARFFKKVGNAIKRSCKKAYISFMKLKKQVRMVIYVWCIVLLVFVVFIISASINNKFISRYEKIEGHLSDAALVYVDENRVFPTKANPVKLSMDMLITDGYLISAKIDDSSCKGYSSIYYDDEHDEFKVKSYINCDKYTTKGYKK